MALWKDLHLPISYRLYITSLVHTLDLADWMPTWRS